MLTIKTDNYEVLTLAQANKRMTELVNAVNNRAAVIDIKDDCGYYIKWHKFLNRDITNSKVEFCVMWQQ